MNRKQSAVAFVIGLSVVFPHHASAEGGLWEFLEKLSGPGPFYGFVLDAPVVCRLGADNDSQQALASGQQCWNRRLLPRALKARAASAGFNWDRTWSFGISFGHFGTKDNNLDYDDPKQAVGIRWIKLGPRATWHVMRAIDLHWSVDVNRLSSKDASANNFNNIWLATIEPVGVTVKPGVKSSSFWRLVTISVRPHLRSRSLDATMFGARPRELERSWDLRWQFGVHIDPWQY